jgi:hypothetical protein
MADEETCYDPMEDQKVYIQQSGWAYDIVVNLDQETFVGTVQPELENVSNTVDAPFRIAFRDDQNNTLAGPTS